MKQCFLEFVFSLMLLTALAQMTYQTGFIVQGNSAAEAVVNTGDTWRVLTNPAYTPLGADDS